MIGVYATCSVKTYDEADFKVLVQRFINESRSHAGNISYDCGAVAGKERAYCFIERWESQAALDAHLAAPFFRENGPKLGDMLEHGLEINVVDLM